MKKILALILFLIFHQNPTKADVVAPNYLKGNISGSFELLMSLEKTVSKNESLLLWGGPGLTSSFTKNNSRTLSLGGELAMEYRRYLSLNTYHKFFLGWYVGMGYMHDIQHGQSENSINHIILGIGFKVGYKQPLFEKTRRNRTQRICLEPYTSAGLTAYHKPGHVSLFNSEKGALWFNIGIRIVFERVFN